MQHAAKSIRAFIGSKDFEISRQFYTDLGFKEVALSKKMSLFKVNETMGFYLQDAYVQDWVDNTMIFLEVDNANRYYQELFDLGLHKKYVDVRLVPVRVNEWGSECFLHDPAGILWHFGAFS